MNNTTDNVYWAYFRRDIRKTIARLQWITGGVDLTRTWQENGSSW